MSYMFQYSSSFNQVLNNWNVKNIRYIDSMFHNIKSFKQDLSLWQIYSNIDLDHIKDYIEPLTRDKLIKALQDRKPKLDGSTKENFLKTRPSRSRNTLKRYKQLVDRISDYMYTNNIDLNSSMIKIV